MSWLAATSAAAVEGMVQLLLPDGAAALQVASSLPGTAVTALCLPARAEEAASSSQGPPVTCASGQQHLSLLPSASQVGILGSASAAGQAAVWRPQSGEVAHGERCCADALHWEAAQDTTPLPQRQLQSSCRHCTHRLQFQQEMLMGRALF